MTALSDKQLLEAIGRKIKVLRKKSNLTQLQLAAKCQNYPEQIGRIERGETNVSVSSLYMIAKGLNVPLKVVCDIDGLN